MELNHTARFVDAYHYYALNAPDLYGTRISTVGAGRPLIYTDTYGRVHYDGRAFEIGRIRLNTEAASDVPQPSPPLPPADARKIDGYWARRRAEKKEEETTSVLPDKECPICLSPLSDVTTTLCGHLFCEACILQCIQRTGNCPTCRRQLTAADVHPIFI